MKKITFITILLAMLFLITACGGHGWNRHKSGYHGYERSSGYHNLDRAGGV